MGRLSEAVFGRRKLPERCLIYAGSYMPKRKEWVKSHFGKWQRIRGYWVKYSYARRDSREYLLIFNVYGAAMILEIIQLLKEGGAKKVFFVGALGGKDLPIGTLVLPTRIFDETGFVSADDPNKKIVEPQEDSLKRMKEALDNLGQAYTEGEIVSVPCVLHNIGHIKRFVEENTNILGVEIETSTFYHYTMKENLESYALLYISDNKEHDIISGSKEAHEARRKALKTITYAATEILK